MPPFTGFPKEGLDFLRALPSRDAAWFKQNRKVYQSDLVEPAKAFVEALGSRLQCEISSGITASPKTNGSIAPVNNDVRFSKDKSPYKDHLLLRFWEGPDKKIAPTLYVRLHPESIGFAVGAIFPSVDRWRGLIDADPTGEPLTAAIARLSKGRPSKSPERRSSGHPRPTPPTLRERICCDTR